MTLITVCASARVSSTSSWIISPASGFSICTIGGCAWRARGASFDGFGGGGGLGLPDAGFFVVGGGGGGPRGASLSLAVSLSLLLSLLLLLLLVVECLRRRCLVFTGGVLCASGFTSSERFRSLDTTRQHDVTSSSSSSS